MYACSPKWQSDWITEDQLAEGLAVLAKYIKPSPYGAENMSLSHGLHFSGGEPFLQFDLLLKAVETAENLKIPSTFVETNCFWCKDDSFTRNRLQLLKKAGLKGIMISVNPFYAEYVAFEKTDRCIQISLEVFDQNVMVYQMEFYHQFKQLGITDKIAIEDYLKLAPGQALSENVEMFLMGRATEQLKMLYPGYPATSFFKVPCQPPIIRNWHNHFDNYGHFMPGFCGGISLGSWFDLDRLVREGVDLTKHPILEFLVNDNMKGLLHFAEDRGYEAIENGYLSNCHLCLDIRKHLATGDRFEELKPKAFYKHIQNVTKRNFKPKYCSQI